MLIKPISWSTVSSGTNVWITNSDIVPSIQLFGYTSTGESIYVRIPRRSTFIIKFNQDINSDIMAEISDIFDPTSLKVSNVDPAIIIVRSPELSPIELTADPNTEGMTTWVKAIQDPHGELESFWEAREISPYDWLEIKNFSPLSRKYTTCDINITVQEDDINMVHDTTDLEYMVTRKIFWDLETFSSRDDQFPSAQEPGDRIFMISIITVDSDGWTGYVLVDGKVDHSLIKYKKATIIHVDGERELLLRFLSIYSIFKPDRQAFFNGDSFDMPYLLNRLAINKIEVPQLSKIGSLKLRPHLREYPSFIGREKGLTLTIPDTEIIDLLHFYRRFYPYFKNHKLDTVSKFFLGEGKTGLSPSDMMTIVRNKDEKRMAEIVDYSYIDSVRMHELWNESDVEETLEIICNMLGVSSHSLLRDDFSTIVDKAIYNIDAGAGMNKRATGEPKHLRSPALGIYKNVYVYDYSDLYRQVMDDEEQPIIAVLAERLESSPPELITTAYYSGYVNREFLDEKLKAFLDSAIQTNMVISIEPHIIRTIGPINAPWLKQVLFAPCYVSVSKASYIVIGENDSMETAGISRLVRPKFDAASDMIKEYLSTILTRRLEKYVMPDLSKISRDKFIMSEKITSINTLKQGSVKHQLASQYSNPIKTWIKVNYVVTQRGPVLVSQLRDTDQPDIPYYGEELKKYLRDLRTLKLYGH